MTHRITAAASLLAASLVASGSAAFAEDTRVLNVWGAHIEVPASRPGGLFGSLSPDAVAPSDSGYAALKAGRAPSTAGYTAGRTARHAGAAAE
ncbi:MULTISPECIES: hypothetical protein [unclassified Methylobacterium]|jgi:hypothetical protein|uniref:hypothetical protein n=1 Tax=unclassified Methylobacterium TaxID=2615210 RepID=UPI00135213C9|nr:hypothetical protein [Methylobacterium sp. 2A]MWV24508.1 hypothetical protein [Methylobacterium sp. 2A]